MRDAPIKRRLLEATHSVCKTNDAVQSLQDTVGMLNVLGELWSAWTGETVRIRMTIEGQADMVDMTKRPGTH